MKTLIFIATVLSALLALSACQSTHTTQENVPEQSSQEMAESDVSNSEYVTFKLTGKDYTFVMNGVESPEIRVKQGDRVRIEFRSTAGYHDWVLDEFSAATSKVRPENGMTSVEFIADKRGTFEYYCSVGSHRSYGMFGKFIVN